MVSALSLVALINNNTVIDGIRLRKAASDDGQYHEAGRTDLDMDHRALIGVNTAAAEIIAEFEKTTCMPTREIYINLLHPHCAVAWTTKGAQSR